MIPVSPSVSGLTGLVCVMLRTGSPSISSYVASCIDILNKEEAVTYELTAMGTIIQSDSLRNLLNIAEKLHNTVLACGAKRAVTTIKIDDRRDKPLTIKGKTDSVEKKVAG